MNRTDLENLIRDPQKWNYYRSMNSEYPHRCDLFGEGTFRYYELRSAGYSDHKLRQAGIGKYDVCDAELTRLGVNGPDLRKINLSGTALNNLDLSRCDLRGANLSNCNLANSNFQHAHLSGANLTDSKFHGTDFSGANLLCADLSRGNYEHARFDSAILTETNLTNASFKNAHLVDAHLDRAYLYHTDFSGADLSGIDLNSCLLIRTNFSNASLNGAKIYGISAWDLILKNTSQNNLEITEIDSRVGSIRVDGIEVAQFIYLMLNNRKIRDIIDTIGRKAVLILGRFNESRKPVLDKIKKGLRDYNYLPILVDFEKPQAKDMTELVSTLAHLSRFIVADITEARSVPQELQSIIPNLPSVIVHPIISSSDSEYSMFDHFKRYPWVLPVYIYTDNIVDIYGEIIKPLEMRVSELNP